MFLPPAATRHFASHMMLPPSAALITQTPQADLGRSHHDLLLPRHEIPVIQRVARDMDNLWTLAYSFDTTRKR